MCLRLKGKGTTQEMNKQEFIEWATSRGWHTVRHGHLRKSQNGNEYRFKLSSVAARYEFKAGDAGWARIRSNYFSQLAITPEGKLAGLLRGGCGSEPQTTPPTINPQTNQGAEMKTFAITPDTNVTVYASKKEAQDANPNGAELFASVEEFAKLAASWPVARLVEVWNTIPGMTPVKKFTSRDIAVGRLWRAINGTLMLPGDKPQAPAPAPADDAPEPVKAGKRAKAVKKEKPPKPPRETKAALIRQMIQREAGASVKELSEAASWQSHSVRGFISNLGRKQGLKVETIKRENGSRAYFLADAK